MNSRFFHVTASAKRKNNRILRLQRDDGVWVKDLGGLQNVALEYSTNLFFDGTSDSSLPDVSYINSRVLRDMNTKLIAPFYIEEFRLATVQMHPDKASGPDDLNPTFYQNFWQDIDSDVFKYCVNYL